MTGLKKPNWPNCPNCYYYRSGPEPYPARACRRYPPQPMDDSGGLVSYFPGELTRDHWCGEWRFEGDATVTLLEYLRSQLP